MKEPIDTMPRAVRGALAAGMVLLLPLLGGCPTVPPAAGTTASTVTSTATSPAARSASARYVAPTQVPTAKLVMRGTNLQAGDVYVVSVYDDAENCKGRRIAGAGNNVRSPTTVPVAAGAITTVEFMLVKAAKPETPTKRDACMVRWSFTPDAGKSYLVAGNAIPTGCSANLIDATNPDAMRQAAGVVRRNVQNSTCLPLAQARAGAGSAASQSTGEAVLRPEATSDDLQGLIGK